MISMCWSRWRIVARGGISKFRFEKIANVTLTTIDSVDPTAADFRVIV